MEVAVKVGEQAMCECLQVPSHAPIILKCRLVLLVHNNKMKHISYYLRKRELDFFPEYDPELEIVEEEELFDLECVMQARREAVFYGFVLGIAFTFCMLGTIATLAL